MVAIIDYDAGNIKSVEKALLHLGEGVIITRDREQILNSDKVILPGEILRIPDKEGIKIPHMGWNSVKIKENARIFKDVPQDSYVYFVHSYYLKAGREEDVAATTEYSTLIHAAVEYDNVFACQFHPEKSSEIGLKILKNFVEL